MINSIFKEFTVKATVEVEKKKLKLIDDLKRNTPVITGKARDGWQSTSRGIENNVDYIDKLNGGSSQQAPAFFIEKTLLSDPEVRPNGIITTPTYK